MKVIFEGAPEDFERVFRPRLDIRRHVVLGNDDGTVAHVIVISDESVAAANTGILIARDVSLLHRFLDHEFGELDRDDHKKLDAALREDEKGSFRGVGPAVSRWLLGVLQGFREAGIRISEGAAASLLAAAIQRYYGVL